MKGVDNIGGNTGDELDSIVGGESFLKIFPKCTLSYTFQTFLRVSPVYLNLELL